MQKGSPQSHCAGPRERLLRGVRNSPANRLHGRKAMAEGHSVTYSQAEKRQVRRTGTIRQNVAQTRYAGNGIEGAGECQLRAAETQPAGIAPPSPLVDSGRRREARQRGSCRMIRVQVVRVQSAFLFARLTFSPRLIDGRRLNTAAFYTSTDMEWHEMLMRERRCMSSEGKMKAAAVRDYTGFRPSPEREHRFSILTILLCVVTPEIRNAARPIVQFTDISPSLATPSRLLFAPQKDTGRGRRRTGGDRRCAGCRWVAQRRIQNAWYPEGGGRLREEKGSSGRHHHLLAVAARCEKVWQAVRCGRRTGMRPGGVVR